VRRQQIAYVCQRGRSVRRACALLSVARSTVGYQPRLPQRDAPAVAAMHELAAQYPRYGYRRIQVFLARRGHAMSTDRAHRLGWLLQANIDTAHIDPGKPWQNGNNESFNGNFRDECLSMEWFRNRIDAKIVIEQFRRQYNEDRPHSSLGQLTPEEFKQQLSVTTNPETAISYVLSGPKKASRSPVLTGLERRK
jgi:transposase InsO family protein